MKAKKIVLLLIICTCALSGSCPGFDSRDLLQSGTQTCYSGQQTIIQGNLNNEFDHTYRTPVNFRIGSDFDIAITTSKIADYNPLPKTGFGYYIEGHRVGLTNLIYRITIKKDRSWSSIQLSYLVSGRPDLALGNLQFNYQQWIPHGQNIYTVLSTIQKDLPNKNYQVAAFISGFSIADPQLILTISRATLNERRLQVLFYTSASLSALSLTISYIIYPETHQFLQISFGPQLADQNGAYQISGPVDFRADKTVQYRQWRVQNRNIPCTSNQCSSSCVLKEECLAKSGNVDNGECTYCPPGIIFENGQCSKRCKPNWLFLYGICRCPNGYKLKGKDCVNNQGCRSFQRFLESSQKCECKQGYARINSICIQCPTDSVVSPSGQTCTCPNNKFYDVISNTCRNRCSQNQEWINNKCECLQSYIWNNQKCRKCPDNSGSSSNHQTCNCKNDGYSFNYEINQCVENIKNQTILVKRRSVNGVNRFLLGISCSYLPECLTKNQCYLCSKILKVKIINIITPVEIKVNYIPFSKYQFLIEYNFLENQGPSVINTVIQLNQDFQGCFTDQDLKQKLQLRFDLPTPFFPQTSQISLDGNDPNKIDLNSQGIAHFFKD